MQSILGMILGAVLVIGGAYVVDSIRTSTIASGPDAQSVAALDNVEVGVGLARKAWLERGDVLNARSAAEVLAFASLVFVGNLDIQGKLPHEKYYQFFEPLPDFLQVTAFLCKLDKDIRIVNIIRW